MKKISITLLAVTTLLLSACNDGDKTSSSETVTTNAATDSTMASDKTRINKMGEDSSKMSGSMNSNAAANFANTAAAGGMMEVEGAKIIRMNRASSEVKNFAKMIEEDHTKANNELKGICSKKNMSVPADMMADQKSHIEEMRKMKGKDLDKHYIDMMVDDHLKDIEEFRNASNSLTDPELKEFATKTLPVLQKHLDKAKALQGKM